MYRVLVPLFVSLVLLPQSVFAQTGDPEAGASMWRSKFCHFCHGDSGEGGFGPDLAGRALTFEQFRHPIRQPWGVMLAYTEEQLPDQGIADLYAHVKTLPPVDEPGHWHWEAAPESAPLGQRIYLQTVGCGQCHEPENKFGRMWLGEHAKDVDFNYFAKQIYTHTEKWPRGGMGNYSRDRVPEPLLREIYKFMVEDLGMRASIGGVLAVQEQQGENTTYTLTVTNRGVTNVGLDAEGVTAFVRIPEGTEVVTGSGEGYQGVQPLRSLGLEPGLARAPHANAEGVTVRPPAGLSGDVVVWKIPKLSAGDRLALSFTLVSEPTAELFEAFNGSTVHWEKPGRTAFGKRLAYRDLRTPDEGDHERINVRPMPD